MATYESKKYSTIPVAATQIADGSVTNAEYQFINSLSSNAQTQITALDAAKLNLAGGTITGNITITDNDHLYIGDGQDIDILSDGSTGFIKGNDLRLQSSTGENYITTAINGATKLFHDNVQKAETTSSGLTVSGTMAATTVTGNIDGASITSGTIPMSRISGTLPALNGSALTNLNASNLSSGTIPMSRISGTLPALNGSALTNLNASNLSSGTIPMARISGTLPALNGSSLTNLNGSNISSGTVADARISTLTASKLTGALPAIDGSALTGIEPVPSSSTSVGTLRTFAAFTNGFGNPSAVGFSVGTVITPATYISGSGNSALILAIDPPSGGHWVGFSSGTSHYIVPVGVTRTTVSGTWRIISEGSYQIFTQSGGQNAGARSASSNGFLAQRIT